MVFTQSRPARGENFLREASPNECRCIVRESVDFYRALVVGGVYEFCEPINAKSTSTFVTALQRCIGQHHHLSISIPDTDAAAPWYDSCPRLDLRQHIQVLDRREEAKTDIEAIKHILPTVLDAKWPPSLPPWKLIVLLLSSKRCFIGFSFSHGLGDGVSAMAFHRTFLLALQENNPHPAGEQDLIYNPKRRSLRPPFDTKKNLPISWSFLLSPLLGTYLPSFLGFRVESTTPTTWTGSSTFYSPEKYQTHVEILSIDAVIVAQALEACRAQGAKLTGLIHEVIVEALSELLPSKFDNFAAQTAIDMRNAVGVSKDEMGLFVAGDMTILTRPDIKSKRKLSVAKAMTDKLSAASGRLQDQSVGLLRYLNDMRGWTLSKLGKARDCSYEISNLTTFQPPGSVQHVSIKEMIFAQPTNVTGPPLQFNIVSVVNGPMNITVTWQLGALDLGGSDENEFVRKLCQEIKARLVEFTR